MHVPTLHFTISAVRIRKYGSLFFNVDVLEIDWRLMSNELYEKIVGAAAAAAAAAESS